MTQLIQRMLLITICSALLILAGWCGYKIHVLSEKHGEVKKDYSIVNGISNGLLSVNVWRDHIIDAADYQIDHFNFTPAQRDTLRYEISQMLHAVINKVDTLLEEKPKSIGGKIKKMVANILIDEDKIHEKVPEFSKTIEQQLLKKKNKDKLKYLVESKLKQLADSTYDSTKNKASIKIILQQYNTDNIPAFDKKVETLLDNLKQKTYVYTYITIGVLVIFLIFWLLLRNKTALHTPFFILSVLLALVVLLVGLTTPMIEIDARIKSLDFQLVGRTISFDDQVIFFQSKSIVDVVHVLLKTGKYDSVLVGILILVFSIIFPISKLVSTGIYLLHEKWKENKIVKFFAFKSGKWSMADVNVIAIFMAYIGFKGILDDQLSNLNVKTDSLTSISTNHTSLQPGYIIFVGFVLFGLMLSLILDKITSATKKEH